MFVESQKQQGAKNPLKGLFKKSTTKCQPMLLIFSIIVLSVYFLGTLLGVSSYTTLGNGFVNFTLLNYLISCLFLADFFYRLFRSEDRPKFFKSHWIDLVLCLPFYSSQWMVVTTTLRSIKIILEYILVEIHSAFKSMMVLGASLVMFAVISIMQFEILPESNIKSVGDALWWSVCTITTVGYGDKFPITSGGKVVAIILMVSGIGLFGTLIGYFSSFFLDKEKKDNDKIDTIEELSQQITDLQQQLKLNNNK